MPRILLALLLLSTLLLGQDPAVLLNRPLASVDQVRSHNGSTAISEIIPVQDMPFTQALRIAVRKGPESRKYDVRLSAKIPKGFAKGTGLTAWIHLRCTASDETGSGLTTIKVLKPKPPHQAIISGDLPIGPEWKRMPVSGLAADAATAGESEIELHLAARNQTIEIGPLELVDHGPGKNAGDLPRHRIDYEGRASDAPWRKQALASIERIRTAEFRIQLVDTSGKPIASRPVRIRQVRNAFAFGSALSAEMIPKADQGDAQAVRYLGEFRRWFQWATIENHLKWVRQVDPAQKAIGDRALAWLDEHDLPLRGHALVWPAKAKMPDSARALLEAQDTDGLRQLLLLRVRDGVTSAGQRARHWDVVNEPHTNHDVQDLLGAGMLAELFVEARKAAPWSKLYLNEFNALNGVSPQPLLNACRALLAAKAPLDGIGLQEHYGQVPADMPTIHRWLKEFAALGPDLCITEFDINTQDEALQADFLRDMLITAYAEPKMVGFIVWGFWEGSHWAPNAAFLRQDWSPRPQAAVWEDYVLKRWRTDATERTRSDGRVKLRAHLGDYRIEVEGTQPRDATLDSDGADLRITVP